MNVLKGLVVLVVLGQVGCSVSLPKMQAGMPVTIDTSFGTPRYQQDGHAIDARDMASKLDNEPDSAPYVKTSRALYVVSLLAAAAGGAMVGVPLGQKAGGNNHPSWVLAGVGGAVFGASIPIGIGAVFSMDKAVEEHNRPGHRPPVDDQP